jgi:hypothetical protein
MSTLRAKAEKLKTDGNVEYTAGRFSRASDLYRKVIPPHLRAIATAVEKFSCISFPFIGLFAEHRRTSIFFKS